MQRNIKTRKIVLGVALISAVALAGLHTAGARPWGSGPYGDGPPCDQCGSGYGYGYQQRQQLDEKTTEARDKFFKETVAVRKEIATKRAEKFALMNNENPDAKRVAELTAELFDLREQLHTKAQEAGLDDFAGRGFGFGDGPGYGRGCNGPGPGGFQRPL